MSEDQKNLDQVTETLEEVENEAQENEGANEQEVGHEDEERESSEQKGQEQDKDQEEEEGSKDYNFQELRKSKEKIEKERDEALLYAWQYYQELNRGQTQQQAPQKEPEPEEDPIGDIGDDDLIEGKHFKKAFQKLKKDYEKSQEQQRNQMVEQEIIRQHPDFMDVVNTENIARLNKEYPEVAESLKYTPDIKKKALSVYNVVKKFGIYEEKNKKDYTKQKETVRKNIKKPRASTSGSSQQGDTPLSKANEYSSGLTPELRKKLREEMRQAAKKY